MFHSGVPGLFWLADVDRRTDRFGFDVHQDQSLSHGAAAEEMQSSGGQTVAGREQLLSEIRFAEVMS